MAYPAKPIEERFWPKVKLAGVDDCWEWQAYKTPLGYGQIFFRNKYHSVHRVSWIMANGEIPEGMMVCHTCDNRACVNPAHMYLGSAKDNCRDREVRLRSGAAKLTPEQVLEIRDSKETNVALAKRYGMGETAIWDIKHRASWGHV